MNNSMESASTLVCYSSLNLLTDLWLAHELPNRNAKKLIWFKPLRLSVALCNGRNSFGTLHMIPPNVAGTSLILCVLPLQMRVFSSFERLLMAIILLTFIEIYSAVWRVCLCVHYRHSPPASRTCTCHFSLWMFHFRLLFGLIIEKSGSETECNRAKQKKKKQHHHPASQSNE